MREPLVGEGSVTIAGVALPNIGVEFVTPVSTYGPAVTDGSGSYTIPLVPLGAQGYVRAVENNRLRFYHTPIPLGLLEEPGDLDISVSGSLTGIDIEVPLPVVLVHGIFSGAGRWEFTEAELHTDLLTRLQTPGYQVAQARVTFPLDYTGLVGIFSLADEGDDVADEISDWRRRIAARHGTAVSQVPIDIIAHSRGGLVSRAFIQDHAGQNEVRRLITLGTPHGGSMHLLRLPFQALTGDLEDMHPFSMWGHDALFGNPLPNSFGSVYTVFRGATLDLVGADTTLSSLFSGPASPGELMQILNNQFSMPDPAYWSTFSTSGHQDDEFITTWSSVVFPSQLAAPSIVAAVRNTALVSDTHTEIPTHSTIEDHILPWLQ